MIPMAIWITWLATLSKMFRTIPPTILLTTIVQHKTTRYVQPLESQTVYDILQQ